jgi:hypothetical protein
MLHVMPSETDIEDAVLPDLKNCPGVGVPRYDGKRRAKEVGDRKA